MTIHKITAVLLAIFILFSSALAATIPQPTLNPDASPYDAEHPEDLEEEQLYGGSAILISSETGEVIFEKEAHELRYPASTTKILTVLLGIIMVDDLDQMVTVSETAMNIPDDSSTMGLHVGEEICYRDVLYGTMMLSGNDGANVIAETVSGSIDSFVSLMNSAVQSYGCENTHFSNAHGYHDDYHWTTAYDMALITREAMKNDVFRDIVSTISRTLPKTNKQKARTITTKSEYMLPGTEEKPNKYYYPDAIGVKTGSHSMAGYCFVGAAERDGVELISVVLATGENARWADTIKLMNYGFAQYMAVTPAQLYEMNPITIETSNYSTSDTNRGKITLGCSLQGVIGSTKIVATKAEIQRMANNLRDNMLIQYTRDFIAPVTAGEIMGTMTYFPENGEAVTYNLVASRSVARRENAPRTLEQIVADTEADPNPFPPFSFEIGLILFGPIVILVLLLLFLRRIRIRRKNKSSRTPRVVNRYVK